MLLFDIIISCFIISSLENTNRYLNKGPKLNFVKDFIAVIKKIANAISILDIFIKWGKNGRMKNEVLFSFLNFSKYNSRLLVNYGKFHRN